MNPILLGTFFTWTATDTEDFLGYFGDFMGDFAPLLVPVVSIFVGIMVIGAFLGWFKK
jgi:hypothetical protein